MTRRIYLLIAVVLLTVGTGCSLTTTVNFNSSTDDKNLNLSATNTDLGTSVQYSGQDGKSALELLRAGYQVEASNQGFVTAIDGTKPGNQQFWAFYVNGKQAEVGAKDYQTHNTDSVEWKLEAY